VISLVIALHLVLVQAVSNKLLNGLLPLQQSLSHLIIKFRKFCSVVLSLLLHEVHMPLNVILGRYQPLLHFTSKCYLFIRLNSLPLCCLLNTYDIMTFMLVTKNAVNAEQLEIFFAEGLKLLAMVSAII
jgi:hypothetical protein